MMLDEYYRRYFENSKFVDRIIILDKHELKVLIDLAIDLNDRKWFMELSKRLNEFERK